MSSNFEFLIFENFYRDRFLIDFLKKQQFFLFLNRRLDYSKKFKKFKVFMDLDRLRELIRESINQNAFKTAIFWADKVASMSSIISFYFIF